MYGILDYRDAIEFIRKMQPDKIKEDFIRIVKFCDIDFKLPENPNYAYCYIDRADIAENLINEYEAITDFYDNTFFTRSGIDIDKILK